MRSNAFDVYDELHAANKHFNRNVEVVGAVDFAFNEILESRIANI